MVRKPRASKRRIISSSLGWRSVTPRPSGTQAASRREEEREGDARSASYWAEKVRQGDILVFEGQTRGHSGFRRFENQNVPLSDLPLSDLSKTRMSPYPTAKKTGGVLRSLATISGGAEEGPISAWRGDEIAEKF